MNLLNALTLTLLPLVTLQKGAGPDRTYGAVVPVLELDGQPLTLSGFGGTTIHHVPTPAAANANRKASRTFENVQLALPVSTDLSVAKWIDEFVSGAGRSQDLRVLEVDRTNGSAFVHALGGARIRSIALSPVGADRQDAVSWTVSLAPNSIDWKQDPQVSPKLKPKEVFANSATFRLQLEGLDTSSVVSIDGVRVELLETPGAPASSAVRVAPIRIAVAHHGVKAWLEWLASKSTSPTNGTLELRDPTGRDVVARIQLEGLTVLSQSRPGGDGTRPVGLEVEFQCSRVRHELPKK